MLSMAHVDQFVPLANSPHNARNYLLEALKRDLVGPGWINGSMDSLIHGSMYFWIHGIMDPWIYGSMG